MRSDGATSGRLDLRARRRPSVLCGVCVAAALVLAGCASIDKPLKAPSIRADQTNSTEPMSDPALALLDYAHHLAVVTPKARETLVHTARDDVRTMPNATDYARLAIALGTPGQRLYTPDEAARYANLSLDAKPSPWTPAARQYLSDYARLYSKLTVDPSPSSTTAPASTNQANQADTADSQQAKIHRLRAALDEAHRKLRALAHIEERLDSADAGT